jgi:hypothetical protein
MYTQTTLNKLCPGGFYSDILELVDRSYVDLYYQDVLQDIRKLKYHINRYGDKSTLVKNAKVVRKNGKYVDYSLEPEVIFLFEGEEPEESYHRKLLCRTTQKIVMLD